MFRSNNAFDMNHFVNYELWNSSVINFQLKLSQIYEPLRKWGYDF